MAKFDTEHNQSLNENLPNILLFIAIFFLVLHLGSRSAAIARSGHVVS
jgi:hypothetical protein